MFQDEWKFDMVKLNTDLPAIFQVTFPARYLGKWRFNAIGIFENGIAKKDCYRVYYEAVDTKYAG